MLAPCPSVRSRLFSAQTLRLVEALGRPADKIDLAYYPLRDGRRGRFNVTIDAAGSRAR